MREIELMSLLRSGRKDIMGILWNAGNNTIPNIDDETISGIYATLTDYSTGTFPEGITDRNGVIIAYRRNIIVHQILLFGSSFYTRYYQGGWKSWQKRASVSDIPTIEELKETFVSNADLEEKLKGLDNE